MAPSKNRHQTDTKFLFSQIELLHFAQSPTPFPPLASLRMIHDGAKDERPQARAFVLWAQVEIRSRAAANWQPIETAAFWLRQV